jgi:hypothetical protein
LEQRPQHLEIEQGFRNVKDKNAWRPIECLSPDRYRVAKAGEGDGSDPCKDGAAADVINMAHKATPFGGVSCVPASRAALSVKLDHYAARRVLHG